MSASRIPPSSTSPTDIGRPGLRAKTVATRLSPEELQEVENAAERDGKSLAEWLREVALRCSRSLTHLPDPRVGNGQTSELDRTRECRVVVARKLCSLAPGFE